MKNFNTTKWKQFIIAESNFGNDIEDRYEYIRPLMVDLPDDARTEMYIDGMEDALMADDKSEFDYYFVEAMKALGLEDQLMENPEADEIADDDLEAAADYFDNLSENDSALDEIINEAKPKLKKALPTIAARNVERNNNINFDIEEMMDMVGQAGKGEDSEEAKILFRASNASDELEQALVDLQIHFEDNLGEAKEEE